MENQDNLKFLNIDTSLYQTRLSKKFENRKSYTPADPMKVVSFIPGTILEILVSIGQDITKDDDLINLDAMKMQNKLKSTVAGKVRAIHVKKGDKVSKGTLLIELE